jgi:hypothetical protein
MLLSLVLLLLLVVISMVNVCECARLFSQVYTQMGHLVCVYQSPCIRGVNTVSLRGMFAGVGAAISSHEARVASWGWQGGD